MVGSTICFFVFFQFLKKINRRSYREKIALSSTCQCKRNPFQKSSFRIFRNFRKPTDLLEKSYGKSHNSVNLFCHAHTGIRAYQLNAPSGTFKMALLTCLIFSARGAREK
jgi:hypothetical protein